MAERHGEPPAAPIYLPPQELWRFTPFKDERFPTPVDERGLVDIEQLITLVKTTVDPSFTWKPSEDPNKHHLYWRQNYYPNDTEAPINPREFRNLAVNKILVPRIFHNWLHLVTEEPPIPDEEIMHYRIEAQRVALKLFSSARKTARLTRLKQVTGTKLEERLSRNFEEFSAYLEEAKAIPEEHQLFDFSHFKAETIYDMQTIGCQLGEIAVRNTTTRVRDVLRPIAA